MIQYLYVNEAGAEQILEFQAKDDPPDEVDGYKRKYALPYKDYNLMTKVQFEQNGRIGYRIGLGDGKSLYRSATKERYEHMVGNTGASKIAEAKRQGYKLGSTDSVFTKSYGEKVRDAKKANFEMHNRNLKKILKGEK